VIGIAAYDPRNGWINWFSGRGRRLDGFQPVDVACPGSTVYSVGRNLSYTPFGGTSSAGPHGAGAAAILRQMFPNRRWNEIESYLRMGALADSMTGTVPNSTWGWGKLRIVDALKNGPTEVKEAAILPSYMHLGQNFPNPFTERTTLLLPRELTGASNSAFSLKVYDLLGRAVLDLTDAARDRNAVTIEAGRLPGAGVYICRLATGQETRSVMMTLLR
jgi:subtilisin family serine protease